MDKFLVRKPIFEETPNVGESSKRVCEEINLDELPGDPSDRRRISKYNPNDRDKVRRAYLQRGPCQPHGHKFPQKVVGKAKRRFNPKWFVLYKTWLEYSVKQDAAFCLFCYLCADGVDESVDTCFTTGGFNNWKKKEKLKLHVGGVNSAHNRARRACEDLNPRDSFSSFNKAKLVRLAELYPSDFSETDRIVLANQLETFLYDMRSSIEFSSLKGIGCLAVKLVEMNKESDYLLVYKLIKLALVLPVSTATVERVFSAMKIVKTRLRSKMGDEWMNDCLVTYIEKEVFKGVLDEVIMKKYQGMKHRRCQLPRKI